MKPKVLVTENIHAILKNIYPLDTGCLWGGKLSALEVNADMNRLVQLECPQYQPIEYDHGHKKKKSRLQHPD